MRHPFVDTLASVSRTERRARGIARARDEARSGGRRAAGGGDAPGALGGDQASLRERFDAPISKATALTQRTLAWFPVRVWRHFLQHNGFLLAAGVSYQALFAIFAAIYVAFAIAGLWLGGSADAVEGSSTSSTATSPA